MIRRLGICRAPGTDPYENLALEETLLDRVGEGELILYLWQNARTVVIGRNQNPWKECRTALLAQEGGRLARRLSGGGAVFHDLGNLNFTFLMCAEDYDLPRQLTVLERACRILGIPAERSGRNDLLAEGRKFSGNAFYQHHGKAYHHGTLMVDVDLDLAQRYLSPSKAKLTARGVDSVRSRVVNLKEFVPDLTIARLAQSLIAALEEVYGVEKTSPACRTQQSGGLLWISSPLRRLCYRNWHPQAGGPAARPVEGSPPSCHSERSEESVSPKKDLVSKYASDAWLYGPRLPFTLAVEDRFPWGGVELQFAVNEGLVRAAKVYTDAMDETLAPRVEAALTGLPLTPAALGAALEPLPQGADLLALLKTAL